MDGNARAWVNYLLGSVTYLLWPEFGIDFIVTVAAGYGAMAGVTWLLRRATPPPGTDPPGGQRVEAGR